MWKFVNMPIKLLTIVLSLFSLQVYSETTESNAEEILTLEVIDPFVEMHTGPGIGYPVFYTVEQGEIIQILTRRPDWYEIKTNNGKIGWAPASQVSRTLLPTGEPIDLPTVSYGDYLKNAWRVGYRVGQFTKGELEGGETWAMSLGYRPLSWLGAGVEYGKFYDSEVRGDFHNIQFVVEPYSDWKVSPWLLLGTGKLSINVQPELTPLPFNQSNFTLLGLGANYYIGRNFVIYTDIRSYSVSTDDKKERLDQWNIGFNAFF